MKTDDKIALIFEHIAKLAASVSVLTAGQAQIIALLTKVPCDEVLKKQLEEQAKTAQALVDQLYEKYPTLLNDDKN